MATPPEYEIITVPAVGQPGREALRQQCYDVRIDVFHHEQGFPLDTEIDEYDEEATHILLRLVPSLKPVGTIRCVKLKDYYKLTRLAVLKDYRQYRFGRALVESLHAFVRAEARVSASAATLGEPGVVKVAAHSQIPVKGFYGRFGYVPEGDEFDEDGAPHQKMVVRLVLSD
ncbi:acyl-CoA N-acyltransferase [Trametes versicolor FP-101664 SS1]|uniref:acyl-CoA N-acyltransferase n=1 Tax=Trametes versicolor (strain FP-101664) TaxID=717944 RepID=UPI000462385F|nr:acyl-CoA N-acyltransferase [Trametes versicolor FP-101664 SS1]EIW61666.1 acyl-CoA N-acyltransferase [Trametes versicolor FP-101664 SS1]